MGVVVENTPNNVKRIQCCLLEIWACMYRGHCILSSLALRYDTWNSPDPHASLFTSMKRKLHVCKGEYVSRTVRSFERTRISQCSSTLGSCYKWGMLPHLQHCSKLRESKRLSIMPDYSIEVTWCSVRAEGCIWANIPPIKYLHTAYIHTIVTEPCLTFSLCGVQSYLSLQHLLQCRYKNERGCIILINKSGCSKFIKNLHHCGLWW